MLDQSTVDAFNEFLTDEIHDTNYLYSKKMLDAIASSHAEFWNRTVDGATLKLYLHREDGNFQLHAYLQTRFSGNTEWQLKLQLPERISFAGKFKVDGSGYLNRFTADVYLSRIPGEALLIGDLSIGRVPSPRGEVYRI